MTTLGIDIGGTSIKLAALGEDGRVLWTRRSAPYSRPNRAELIARLRETASGSVSAPAPKPFSRLASDPAK